LLRIYVYYWNLNGDSNGIVSRTRHGGAGRPNLARRSELLDLTVEGPRVSLLSSSSASSDDGDWSFEETSSDESEEAVKKPDATRVIMDADGLKTTLEENCRCKKCNGPLTVSLVTVLCLATNIMMYCKNARCGFIYYSPPPSEVLLERDNNKKRSTDYAINILYVLGFMSCGDGCVKAARVLGLLGLSNDTTMETRSFGLIENRISNGIQEVTRSILLDNLVEEACLSMENTDFQDRNDYDQWKQSIEDDAFVLSKNKWPRLVCSFDMGWQQRASGVRYNSQSGHGLLVGGLTRKPICYSLKSKRCNFCITWKSNNKATVEAAELDGEELLLPPHNCTRNHDGTSSAMEARACLDMVVEMHEKYHCIVASICCDDDASTRAMVKWSNADWMVNNNSTVPPRVMITGGKLKGKTKIRESTGRLPGHIDEPHFVADPNHRQKILMKELIGLAKLPMAQRFMMTTMDASRLEKNFTFMIRQLPKLDETEYFRAGQAVLNHHFDCHDFCGNWCPRKRLSTAERALPKNKRFY
jgi:hypothetical protein